MIVNAVTQKNHAGLSRYDIGGTLAGGKDPGLFPLISRLFNETIRRAYRPTINRHGRPTINEITYPTINRVFINKTNKRITKKLQENYD